MLTKDFYFDLPEMLIAQYPSEKRGGDRLMVLDRSASGNQYAAAHSGHSACVRHCMMSDLITLIEPGTLMVFNNSRVRRSRCYAEKVITAGADNGTAGKKYEFLFLGNLQNDAGHSVWKAMAKNAKKIKPGSKYAFSDGSIGVILENPDYDGTEFRLIAFNHAVTESWFDVNGHIPLPPYIKRPAAEKDSERYQNVYAKKTGSAACPTAGLHFTEDMLRSLSENGVDMAEITLHVGLGTFLPVRSETVEEHIMHEEVFTIPPDAAEKINAARAEHRKILAVGTTTVRSIESAWNERTKKVESGTRSTNIFIYPGKKIHVVDQLFTNFHTPESTLLMLVSAFAGKNIILDAYKQAVEEKYRFFSYGDAMLIL
ncbi:MAG: tRNA preQ1(34) S-adenosylmethionine ribosyltransferase-isomerase QueA [Bacteroides sp.]|nr:tRNA preQ1(34) S-adenosylmethionine ribosyltransferase-isomerase QueA [Prevotella sp.]MCM1407241.1 tRNA preQ1(34) S-adenosylmethionine ribosyltransferase-isomerase QueA [Treponema brennaborense]MCM1469729.1 tRNA preQ1(34) S-adenosylmethionine ribosyltransferase-isomerase QueA [Bacteroides sp.]